MEVGGWGLEGEQWKKAEEDVFYKGRRGGGKKIMHGRSCLLPVQQAKLVGHWGMRNNRNDRQIVKRNKGRQREKRRGPSVVSLTAA